MGAMDKIRMAKNLPRIIRMINQLNRCKKCAPLILQFQKENKDIMSMELVKEKLESKMCPVCLAVVEATVLKCAKSAGLKVER